MVLLAVTATALLLAYAEVYVVRERAGGVLYWNENEALLFIEQDTSGAHMSYLRYAVEPILVSMGDVQSPNDSRCSKVVVIQVTDKDVRNYATDLDRYVTDSYCGGRFAVFEGRIYADSGKNNLWKWSSTHFEPVTTEELHAFDAQRGLAAARPHPWEFDGQDGWSMRSLGQTLPKYQLLLNGQTVTILFSGKTWPPRPLSISLQRSGQPPQTIWSFDEQPHRVGKAEYEKLFERR
jgi:hypothetical protein